MAYNFNVQRKNALRHHAGRKTPNGKTRNDRTHIEKRLKIGQIG